MARVRISDLTAAGALADADLFPVVQSGSTKKATLADIVSKVQPIRQGLLSARPAASSVPNASCYFATDEDGGTLYLEESDAWIRVGSAVGADTGKILSSVVASSGAAFTISAAPGARCPELTTPSFTMPSNPCTVSISPTIFTGVASAGLSMTLRYTTDGWSTAKSMFFQNEDRFASNTSYFYPATCRLMDASSGTAPSAGSTVQVAAWIGHASDTSVQLSALGLINVVPLLEVRAG